MTDTHLAPGGKAVLANCDAVRGWVAAAQADITLHLGDVTAEGAVHADHFGAGASALGDWPTPLHILPGNHDIGDIHDVARSPSEPPVDRMRLDRYRRALGADRWRLAAEGWTLIGLNALLLGWDDEETAAQSAWLDDVLAESDGPVALFLHKPLFRTAPEDIERHIRYIPPEPRRRLLHQLAGADLRLVISGHTHQLRRHQIGPVEHVWAPSCAFYIPDSRQEVIGEKVVGTMLLTLAPGGYRLDFVGPQGITRNSLLDQTDIYPQLLTEGAPTSLD